MSEKQLTSQAEIVFWLDDENRDYRAGVALFEKYSRNKSMLHFFQRKGNEALSRLEYQLRKLAGKKHLRPAEETKRISFAKAQESTEIRPPALTVRTEIKIGRADGIKFEDLPESLQPLYSANTDDYKAMRSLHEKMKLSNTDEDRARFRAELVKLDDAVAKRWEIIDKWAETGELPNQDDENTDENKTGANKLTPQQVGAHRASISRNLEHLENTEGVSPQKWEEYLKRLLVAASALLDDGQSLAPATLDRIRKFAPSFGSFPDT